MNEIAIRIVSPDLALEDIVKIRDFTSYSFDQIKAAHKDSSKLHLLNGNLFWKSASIVEFLQSLKCKTEVLVDGRIKKVDELKKISKEAKGFSRADM